MQALAALSLICNENLSMNVTVVSAIFVSPFISSFLGVVADRWPTERPFVAARSNCDRCGQQLAMYQMIPIVTWVAQRGRCAHCSGPISFFYPAMEIAAIIMTTTAFQFSTTPVNWISICLGFSLLTLAAMDIRHFVLADFITVPLAAMGLLVACRYSSLPMLDHTVGLFVGFFSLFGLNSLYRFVRKRDGLGLGDAKLLAAAGAWLGWESLPSLVLWATMISLLIVICMRLAGQKMDRYHAFPFGAFLALGFWITWLAGPITFEALS